MPFNISAITPSSRQSSSSNCHLGRGVNDITAAYDQVALILC